MTSESNITLEERYRLLRQELTPFFGSGEATSMARLIFHALKGWDTTGLVVHAPDILSPYILTRIDEIVDRLKGGEPLQYILGEGRFYGMTLEVNPSTLIPRQETEELVEIIIKESDDRSDLRVLDIGTGSGAIAIALSRNLRFPKVTAIDISSEAVDTARRNAGRLHADVEILQADVFDLTPKRESLDIIVSNPPYICEKEMVDMEKNVLDHEPHAALFVPDDDPLKFYRRIAEIGTTALVKGGRIYFEINPIYADDMQRMMESFGYSDVRLIEDISHRKRFCTAVKTADLQ